jgi:hypothetical protein
MKKTSTLILLSLVVVSLKAQMPQIFHKKYAYSNEIMYAPTSVLHNTRIYTAASSVMMPGMFSVQKTDFAGNLEKTQTIWLGTSVPTVMIKKMIVSGSKLYLVGSIKSGTYSDGCLIALDTMLSSMSYCQYFGTTGGNEEFNDVIKTSNNDLVMVGYNSVPTATAGVSKYNPYVVRATSATGSLVYQRAYSDGMDKYAYSVLEDGSDLYVAGAMPMNNGSFILKINNDNIGNTTANKVIYYTGSPVYHKNIQVANGKIYLIGHDQSNYLTIVPLDMSLNMSGMIKYHNNFRYQDIVHIGKTNYIVGLTPTGGTVTTLLAMRLDSLYSITASTSYFQVNLPTGVNWYGANIVNNNNTLFLIANEAWTAPSAYTNRYIVGADFNLNAVCNNTYTVGNGNFIGTSTIGTFTAPLVTYTTGIYTPMMYNSLSPVVTALCPTAIESINGAYDQFSLKFTGEKYIIDSPYSEYEVSLFDMSGKQLRVYNATQNTEEVSLENYPNGIYILKLNTRGYEQRFKLIR